MIYTVHNEQTGRSFETVSMFEVRLDTVWLSVCSMFEPGSRITISDELGNRASFVRQGRKGKYENH